MPQARINDITVEYRFDGAETGPVILLSNSLASNYSMWDAQMPALVDAGFRVLRYDSRGHGATSVPPGPYTLELLVCDAVALLDHLGLDEVCMMGCSKGGMIGQMLATVHPQRLRALVLASTAAFAGGPDVWEPRIAAVSEGGMQAVLQSTVERWVTAPGRERLPQELARIEAMIAATPAAGFCGCCAAIRDMDQREAIKAITTPTHVIVGEHDPGTPVSAAQLIHDNIRGSGLTIIPDSAHFVHMEQAEAFNSAMMGFLKDFA